MSSNIGAPVTCCCYGSLDLSWGVLHNIKWISFRPRPPAYGNLDL